MHFKSCFAAFVTSFHIAIPCIHGNFVVSQYSNDYFDSDNSIDNDVSPYNVPRARQFVDDPINDEVATATLLVGGAAIIGAIGMVGIAFLQGLNDFQDSQTKFDKIEQKLDVLERQFDDEQEDHDESESRLIGLCNLGRQLNNINVMGNLPPNLVKDVSEDAGDDLVPAINQLTALLGQIKNAINGLPNACNGQMN